MYEFILPDIGEGISEALLISWSVQPGEQVEEDQEVATISTDKVNVELPSPRAGIVAELCWEPGDTVKVGSVFLRIETISNEEGADDNAHPVTPEQLETEPSTSAAVSVKARPQHLGDRYVIAAPSTRKLAQELGINITTVTGSGPNGQVLREDLQANTDTETHRQAPSGVRAVMAQRMAYSVHTLAHSTMNFEVPADGLLVLRERLRSETQAASSKVSMSVILAKCVASVLTRHGRFNATIDEDVGALLLHDQVHLGLALASDQGLTVPVLRNVQDQSLFDFARNVDAVVSRGRKGQLTTEDYRDGTFTLSNTGSLEKASILSTRPVINAPQAAILWVSRIKTRPRVTDDRLEAGPMINCSLSFDHRFIDGADCVAFINELSDWFQSPQWVLDTD